MIEATAGYLCTYLRKPAGHQDAPQQLPTNGPPVPATEAQVPVHQPAPPTTVEVPRGQPTATFNAAFRLSTCKTAPFATTGVKAPQLRRTSTRVIMIPYVQRCLIPEAASMKLLTYIPPRPTNALQPSALQPATPEELPLPTLQAPRSYAEADRRPMSPTMPSSNSTAGLCLSPTAPEREPHHLSFSALPSVLSDMLQTAVVNEDPVLASSVNTNASNLAASPAHTIVTETEVTATTSAATAVVRRPIAANPTQRSRLGALVSGSAGAQFTSPAADYPASTTVAFGGSTEAATTTTVAVEVPANSACATTMAAEGPADAASNTTAATDGPVDATSTTTMAL